MKACEICGTVDYKLWATRIREGEGRVLKCNSCGLLCLDEGIGPQELREYYEKEYQETNSLVANVRQDVADHFHARLKTIGSVYRRIQPFLPSSRSILEVGCGAGELLSLVKGDVDRCMGLELNRDYVSFINERLGIEAYAEDLTTMDFKNRRFDLIISIATLDHLPNPFATLEVMKNLLSPQGRIYIEVPNLEEALNCCIPEEKRKRYNRFFYHRAHFYYFNRNTITALFKKAGLQVDVACRHEYTLKNLLHWYFTGEPQGNFVTAVTETDFFSGSGAFEARMNGMFGLMEGEFKTIMAETFRGDNLCCTAWV